MFFLRLLKLNIILLSICHCFYVEIKLTDINESRSVTLICGPPEQLQFTAADMDSNKNYTILWYGSNFGVSNQERMLESMQTDILVPNIAINASEHHKCYLLAPESTNKTSLAPQKKRVSREDSQAASIPSENGMCPPGHRIDQDQCFPCFPGSYSSGQESACHLCPKDFYVDKTSADACWPCPGGKFTQAQGADSEESCVYFDETGHPLPPQTFPWIAIIALICVIIICIWIIIIVLWTFYWRHKHKDDIEQPGSGRGTRSSKPLLSGSDSNIYESASDFSDSDDHIYAEIGDFDDYEIPRKPSDDYEIPRKPSDDYEVPKKPSDDNEVPRKLDDDYEVPRKPGDDYDVPRKALVIPDNLMRSWKPTPVRQKDSAEDHIYETLSSDDHIYEAPTPKRTVSQPTRSDDDYLQPIRRGENEGIYDDVMYVTVENETGNNPYARTRSKGFEPGSISATRKPSEGLERAERRKSSAGVAQNGKPGQEK